MRLEWILVLVAAAVVWAAKAEDVASKTLRLQTVRTESVELDGKGSKIPFCNVMRTRFERRAGMVADTSSALVKKADKEFGLDEQNHVLGNHVGAVDEASGRFQILTTNPNTIMGYTMIRVLEGKLGKGLMTDTRQIHNSKRELVCQLTITHLTVSDVISATK